MVATMLIETFGGIYGGVLATSPTIVVACIYTIIKFSNTHNDVIESLYIIPVSVLLDIIYLGSWIYGPRVVNRFFKGNKYIYIAIMFFFTISIWFAGAIVLI